MKTVLFVPGFREDLNTRDYMATIKAIETCGYNVKFVEIAWKQTTIAAWGKELDAVYAQYDSSETILAGFSYGAMAAFVSATRRNPSELWLFSLSPYFAEDLQSKNMKAAWLKGIGHRRVTAFGELNFKELAKSIKCKTLLFVGQLEMDKWPVVNERSVAAHKLLENNLLVVVEGAGHDVTNDVYIQAIKSSLT